MTVIKTPTGLVNTLDGDPEDRPVRALADAAALAGLGSVAPSPIAPPPVDKAAAAKDRKNAAARAKRAAGAAPMNAKAVKAVKVEPPAPKAKAPKVKAAASPLPSAADQYLGRKSKAPTGGSREGAGRKPLDGKEAMHTVSFKCSEAQHATFRDIPGGGAAWIRWGLDQYREAKKAGKLL